MGIQGNPQVCIASAVAPSAVRVTMGEHVEDTAALLTFELADGSLLNVLIGATLEELRDALNKAITERPTELATVKLGPLVTAPQDTPVPSGNPE